MGGTKKIRLIQKVGLSVGDINAYLHKYKGKVRGIVIDQLRKVRGFDKAGSDMQKIQQLAEWARDLAKQHCPVIVTHQLGTEARNEKYPDQSMLYGCKTELAGECDNIIMLGNENEGGLQKERYVSIAKVKDAIGPMVEASMRNANVEVHLIPEKAMFKEFD